MSSPMLIAGREHDTANDPPATQSELRRAYFAHAGEVAARYEVRFERVVEHLEEARTHHSHSSMPGVRQIDDLVHVVACIDGVDVAWWDLTEQHERALVRACRQWLEPTDAIVLVRRLIADLRRDDVGVQSLRGFDGTCTLRRWLGDRIMGRMNLCGVGFHLSRGPAPHPPRVSLLEGHFIAGNVIWRRTADPPPTDDPPRVRPCRQA